MSMFMLIVYVTIMEFKFVLIFPETVLIKNNFLLSIADQLFSLRIIPNVLKSKGGNAENSKICDFLSKIEKYVIFLKNGKICEKICFM